MGSKYLVKAILAISLEDLKLNPTYTPDQSHRDSQISYCSANRVWVGGLNFNPRVCRFTQESFCLTNTRCENR